MPLRLEGVLLMTLYLIIAISAWYVAVSCVREIALLRAAQVLPSGSWFIDLHVYGYFGSTPARLSSLPRKQTSSEGHERIRAMHSRAVLPYTNTLRHYSFPNYFLPAGIPLRVQGMPSAHRECPLLAENIFTILGRWLLNYTSGSSMEATF